MLESLRGSRKLSGIWNIRTQGIDSRQGAKHAKFGFVVISTAGRNLS
jgi:hypothetical protein